MLRISRNGSDALFQQSQRRFMEDNGLWNAASSRERALFEKPLGSWPEQNIADGQWRSEALGVLLWALGKSAELAPYDETSLESATASLPDPDACASFVKKATLRSETEIVNARDTAELWLWRARTTEIQIKKVTPPDGWTFEKIIALAAERAESKKLFTPINGDFPAHGKAYSKLSEDEWHTMRSIAQERLYALNWLCKYAADWDAVPTGT